MNEGILNAAWTSIIGTGVVGCLLIVTTYLLIKAMVVMREDHSADKKELREALKAKDAKLESTYENVCKASAEALNNVAQATRDNADATRENTRVLSAVPCVTEKRSNK